MSIKSSVSTLALSEAIPKGLTYLHQTQRPSGEFATYTSARVDLAGPSPRSKSNYVTTLVIHALSCLPPDPTIASMQHQAADFLEAERDESGTWNYDGRGERRIPNDFDGTCCTVAALLKVGRHPPLSFYALFWENESAPGGPYYTWLGVNDRPAGPLVREIDLMSNANILFCSGLLNLSLPGTVAYLTKVIEADAYQTHSIYSVSPHFLIYCLSRAYADGQVAGLGPAMPIMQKYLLTQLPPPSAEPSAFNLACLTASLFNLQADPPLIEPYLTALLTTQQPDGGWAGWAAWRSYRPNYDGSPALTTALAVEALGKYLSRNK